MTLLRHFNINFLVGTLALTIAVAPLTSCKKKEGCTDPSATNYDPDADKDCCCEFATPESEPTQTINGETYYVLNGNVSSSRSLVANRRYLISGGLFVASGATLTIEEGTRIYAADDGTTPFLSIQRGGRINAVGTASAPIVFTTIKTVTGNPDRGDWGGIVINGYGRINICSTDDCTAEGEGGSGTYGGTNDADDSGVMKYVRVEYAGKILGTDNELNGFSFNGVGSGTVLEHLQAYKGSDDGFEFFGGTVNLKWAVSTGNSDDSFDWTHGWRGKGQFWVVQQDAATCDNGFECDNWETDYNVTPTSDPMISNFTLVGANDGSAASGMRLRHGTKGRLWNGLVTGFDKGVRVGSECDAYVADGTLFVKNSNVFNNGANWDNAGQIETEMSYGNLTDAVSLSGYVGTEASGAVDPSTVDSWFSSVNFKGAVEAGNDWTANWTVGL
ncbi:MAG: hypothetical protein KDC00_07855 [Flavobacteriales bacterium]|nr:hypothetical protein [Flavobacteriales bacterium]